MINDYMLEGMAKLAVGESFTIPSHLAFGSDSDELSAADVVTSGEFDRNALTTLTSTDTIAKFIGNRTAAEASDELIQLVGLHNSASLGSSDNLCSNFLIASLTHTTDFDVEVEFWMDFQRG